VPALDKKGRPIAVRWIAGIRFVSGGDGHYYSDDGRFGLIHMLRGMPEVCWELWTLDGDGQMDECLDSNPWLGMLQREWEGKSLEDE
jgi:hypothetical protein